MCESDGRVYGCSGNVGGSNKTRIGTLEAPTEACCKELNGGPRLIDPGGTVHDQVEDNNSRGRQQQCRGLDGVRGTDGSEGRRRVKCKKEGGDGGGVSFL
jgi:hypothetical protein